MSQNQELFVGLTNLVSKIVGSKPYSTEVVYTIANLKKESETEYTAIITCSTINNLVFGGELPTEIYDVVNDTTKKALDKLGFSYGATANVKGHIPAIKLKLDLDESTGNYIVIPFESQKPAPTFADTTLSYVLLKGTEYRSFTDREVIETTFQLIYDDLVNGIANLWTPKDYEGKVVKPVKMGELNTKDHEKLNRVLSTLAKCHSVLGEVIGDLKSIRSVIPSAKVTESADGTVDVKVLSQQVEFLTEDLRQVTNAIRALVDNLILIGPNPLRRAIGMSLTGEPLRLIDTLKQASMKLALYGEDVQGGGLAKGVDSIGYERHLAILDAAIACAENDVLPSIVLIYNAYRTILQEG